MASHQPHERLVFVDLETAGLETWRPIIQIAAVAVTSSLTELESFERKLLFNRRFACPASLHKNNFSWERWQREGQRPKVVAKEFSEFLRRHATLDLRSADGRTYQVAQLVAHNAAFDGGFLQAWFERLCCRAPRHVA